MELHEDVPDRAYHLRQLRSSLQALASAGSGQQALFAEEVEPPSVIASRFDHWAAVVRAQYGGDLPPPLLETLAGLEAGLATMSRDGAEFDAEVWTEAAAGTSERWAEIRRLAASALESCDWPLTS